MKLTVANSNISNNLSTAKLTLANGTISDNLTIGNVSVTPSQISVGNVSITPTAVSVPTLVLGGAQFSGGLQGGIINYQEFTANGTWYNPYANASVNASLTGYEQVLVMAWGGGGGGHSNGTSGSQIAGGGGACVISTTPLLYFSNTCSVVVGNGGAVNRTSSGVAAFGGNTIFTINATANIVAYGGGPADGSSTSSGGGGGTLGPATNFGTGGGPLGGSKGSVSTFGGGGGLGNNSGSFTGGTSIFGGGAGSGASFAGANSIYGGGGGGAGGSVGGTSIFGGNGGSGGLPAGIPGGGGGSNSTSANSGARGEVRVWTFGPAGTTAGAPTYSLTANTTTLYGGASVLYTVSTTNVSNGTTLYYTLNNSSTAISTDFTTAVNGSVTISEGTGTFTLTANGDADATNEAFTMDVRTSSTTGSIVVSNGSVSIIPVGNYVYNGLYQPTQTSSNASATIDVGTAHSSRLLVLGLAAYTGYEGYPVTVTVNGVQANLVATSYYSPDHSYYLNSIYSIPLPTGTTANVVITSVGGGFYSGEPFAIASYSLYGLQSQTPNQIKPGTVSGSSSVGSNTVTFTSTQYGDIVIGVCALDANNTVWTGDMAAGGGASSWIVGGTGSGYTSVQTGVILQLANNKTTISYSHTDNDIQFYSAHALWR